MRSTEGISLLETVTQPAGKEVIEMYDNETSTWRKRRIELSTYSLFFPAHLLFGLGFLHNSNIC